MSGFRAQQSERADFYADWEATEGNHGCPASTSDVRAIISTPGLLPSINHRSRNTTHFSHNHKGQVEVRYVQQKSRWNGSGRGGKEGSVLTMAPPSFPLAFGWLIPFLCSCNHWRPCTISKDDLSICHPCNIEPWCNTFRKALNTASDTHGPYATWRIGYRTSVLARSAPTICHHALSQLLERPTEEGAEEEAEDSSDFPAGSNL